jgi:transcriptional regulator with XRE-family HTH domain
VAEYSGAVRNAASLGRILAQARQAHGWSQRDLAARLGTSQRYVWEMEAGKPSIYTDRLFAAMRATGMKLTATIQVPDPEGGVFTKPPRPSSDTASDAGRKAV